MQENLESNLKMMSNMNKMMESFILLNIDAGMN